jgi:hypothetical protein
MWQLEISKFVHQTTALYTGWGFVTTQFHQDSKQ